MLVIRQAQMSAFQQVATRRFEAEMVAHSKEFSPTLCAVIGDGQLLVALRSAMTRAKDYGFTNRGPVRLYIEMMFLCGSDFDTDPQFPALRKALREPADQMQRAEQIHRGFLEYLENVSGPGARNVHKALRDLLHFVTVPLTLSWGNFVPGILENMRQIFPQRAAYVGEVGLKALVEEGIAAAQEYGFTTVRAAGLLVVLKFAFGHGCTRDPLYPWISRTLGDSRIVDAEARAMRLEKKAVTWLKHVVAGNERRAPA
jgi:hypothetical protein